MSRLTHSIVRESFLTRLGLAVRESPFTRLRLKGKIKRHKIKIKIKEHKIKIKEQVSLCL